MKRTLAFIFFAIFVTNTAAAEKLDEKNFEQFGNHLTAAQKNYTSNKIAEGEKECGLATAIALKAQDSLSLAYAHRCSAEAALLRRDRSAWCERINKAKIAADSDKNDRQQRLDKLAAQAAEINKLANADSAQSDKYQRLGDTVRTVEQILQAEIQQVSAFYADLNTQADVCK